MRIVRYISVDRFDSGSRWEFDLLPHVDLVIDNGRVSTVYLGWLIFHAEIHCYEDSELRSVHGEPLEVEQKGPRV